MIKLDMSVRAVALGKKEQKRTQKESQNPDFIAPK